MLTTAATVFEATSVAAGALVDMVATVGTTTATEVGATATLFTLLTPTLIIFDEAGWTVAATAADAETTTRGVVAAGRTELMTLVTAETGTTAAEVGTLTEAATLPEAATLETAGMEAELAPEKTPEATGPAGEMTLDAIETSVEPAGGLTAIVADTMGVMTLATTETEAELPTATLPVTATGTDTEGTIGTDDTTTDAEAIGTEASTLMIGVALETAAALLEATELSAVLPPMLTAGTEIGGTDATIEALAEATGTDRPTLTRGAALEVPAALEPPTDALTIPEALTAGLPMMSEPPEAAIGGRDAEASTETDRIGEAVD